jgi:ABC-type polysaccharide/polyol phosphate export permease
MEVFDAVNGVFSDIAEGVRLSPLWWKLGLEQTIARYRRTLLGPFWVASSTISTGLALSIVFGTIFGGDWRGNFPFILSGVLCFQLSSGLLSDGAGTFIGASGLMQIRNLPLSFHSFLMCDKQIINFAHQILAFWLVTACFGLFPLPHWSLLLTLPLIIFTGFLFSFPLGMLSARYRDVNYFIGFILQGLFMLTPVFWRRSQIPPKLQWIVDLNPLAHMLEVLRQPFLGHPPPLSDLEGVMVTLAVGLILAVASLALFRKRVVFWL